MPFALGDFMDGLFIVFANSLTALALCLAVGFICRKTLLINDTHTAGLTNLLVRVAMPCTVFISLMRPFSRDLLLESVATVFITGVIYILGGFIGKIITKVIKCSNGERQGWQFGTAFGNVGFMGIPVIAAVYGQDAVIYVAMALTSFNLLSFTFGARMFDNAPKKINIRDFFVKNPVIVAIIIGIVFFASGLRLPTALESGISSIGSITTPLSMIILGIILARQRLSIQDVFSDIKIFVPIAAKLLLIPLTSLAILFWFVPNPLMLSVIVTLMSMPPAALAAIFAEQYGADSYATTKFIVMGTVLCVITVPAVAITVEFALR